MDSFVVIIGIIGLALLLISLIIIISAIVHIIKRRIKVKKFIVSIIIFLILFAFASSFIYLSFFLQTFSRYSHVERIGWVKAEPVDNNEINMEYFDEKGNRLHWCTLCGDQWVIEGYFLRWSLFLRWLGAGSYYRVTRFTGRWEVPKGREISVYQIHPEEKIWKFILKYGEKIPFIEAAYGIGAFQYPRKQTFYIYINDTGFILKSR
jgi:hypothetical protein